MCVISILEPGQILPKDWVTNAVYNNPHGFGLILKDPKRNKMEVIKKCPEKGTDPEEILDLLEDNLEMKRYLHLRWRTDGPVDVDNAHPFTSYYSDRRQVYFMHNGTLHSYKPRAGGWVTEGGVRTEIIAEDASDTKLFNERVLQPLLLRWEGSQGRGDISDPVFCEVIDKYWGATGDNKGILICNDLDDIYINRARWSILKDTNDDPFFASNDSYFKQLVRGPVFEELKKVREKEEAEKRAKASRFHDRPKIVGTALSVSNLKNFRFHEKTKLPEEVQDIFNDVNLYTRDGLSQLENLTPLELESIAKNHPEELTTFLVFFTSEYAGLFAEHLKTLTELGKLKNEKAQEKS